ncbi:MAG: MFS transporter [Desulfomonile tiedjei]|uniref:MFS transporter n=1 Tax=Desulfomonile tiedjei TaxID=2358 RepID=A0A9D6Z2I6_9BACT|nr:MFS transporter [Desulfomonile tiedjei]
MTTSFLFTFIVRFSWPPLIPVVVPVLNMSMAKAGAYMSAFYFGYIITQIPGGLLADRFGARLILTASLIIEGITTFGMGFITTYDTGFALRVATGLGAGALYGACTRTLFEWFPAEERGTAFGIMLAGPSGGILVSSFVMPLLNSTFGWQGAFQAVGVATIIVGMAIFLLVRSSDQSKSAGSMFGGFRIVFGSKEIMLTALSCFCLMWVELGTATWAFAHIKKLGLELKVAGTVMMFYGIGGLLSPAISGIVSDRIGHRKWIYIVSLLVIAPMTVLFGAQTEVKMLCIVGFLFGFCSYFANPHVSIMISEFAGKKFAGLANGSSNAIFQLASMIGPFVMGWGIDITGNFSTVWWIMAAGPLVGIVLMLPVNPENKRD